MLTKESVIAAQILVESEGDRALLVAAHRACERRLVGDDRGAQVWENVVEALLTSRAEPATKGVTRPH